MENNKVINYIDSINLEEFLDTMIEMTVSPIYSYIVESNKIKPKDGNLVDFVSEKISNKTGVNVNECKDVLIEYLNMYNDEQRNKLMNHNFIEVDTIDNVDTPDMKSLYLIKNDDKTIMCLYSKENGMFVPLAETDLEIF